MKTILIVEDEIDIAEVLQSLLEFEGYRVVLAVDGLDGLEKAVEHKPDLIITDLMMPRLDGDGLIERVRAHPALNGMPIVAMSANQQGHELPFLRKPFPIADLLALVRRLLGS